MKKTLIALNAIIAVIMFGYWFDMDFTYYFHERVSLLLAFATAILSIVYLSGITEFSMLFDRIKNNRLAPLLQQKIKSLKNKS